MRTMARMALAAMLSLIVFGCTKFEACPVFDNNCSGNGIQNAAHCEGFG